MSVQYTYVVDPVLERLLERLSKNAELFDTLKEQKPELWPIIQKKLRILWTSDSNALEGSTLSFAETLFFLEEGLTVEGKPLKDFVDARNHADAIEYLMEVIKDERPITTSLMKEVNALLLKRCRKYACDKSTRSKSRKTSDAGRV